MALDALALGSYGALLAAGLLCVLYVYRGRAFIVYWIVGWLLLAARLALGTRATPDLTLAAVAAGLAQLLAAWSAGLLLLAAYAFPDAPLRWTTPLRVAAGSAAWFLAAPFLLPVRAVLWTGRGITALLLAWAALRYVRLFRQTGYAGGALVAAGLAVLAASGAAAPRLLPATAVTIVFVALAMHLLVFEDMTSELRRANRELAAANDEVRRLAITDPLTGCYNRRFFDQIQRREMQRHRRYGSPLSVMFVDVNRFKMLNDTLGHERGDGVLKTIGALLRARVRETDYVIRWGGDEFLLILVCTFTQAERKAAELKAAFRAEPALADLPDDVGLGVGISSVSHDAAHLEEAIRLADERMYQDKFASRAKIAT
jgi:diguanylate cyclase (GGDEF)-like protein